MADLIAKLKSSLPIDINSLHINAQEQPSLAADAGELAANLKAEAKRLRMKYEVAKATADKEIRNDPATYGLAKVTETCVASAVTLHPMVRTASDEMLEADKEADLAAVIQNAFEHRRSMLKIEADLYVNNYWGSPEGRSADMSTVAQVGNEQKKNKLADRRRSKQDN